MRRSNLPLCLFLILLLLLPVAAAETGSLTLQEIEEPVCLYRVAGSDGKIREAFADSGLEIPGEDPVSTAKKLNSFARNQEISGQTVTPEKGEALFAPLEEGLYLVCSLGQKGEFAPFLVSVPTVINQKNVYHIQAKPKQEETPPQTTTAPTEAPPSDSHIPQTGSSVIPKYTLLAVGSLMTLAGLYQVVRGKRKSMNRQQKRGWLMVTMGLCMVLASLTLHVTQQKQDDLAGENAAVLLEHMKLNRTSIALPEAETQAPVVQNSAMPEKDYLGYSMIGTLRVPALGIELPILSSWSYELLDIAPCRYSGSIPNGNMILMGHNYKSHFTPLHRITTGTEVEFEDVNGVLYRYNVTLIETLHKSQIEKLPSEHPLTLFTCTAGGQNRIVIRCEETA